MAIFTQPVIRLIPPVLVMGLVILFSNILVQHPVFYKLGGIDLADWLTWGAFTFPIAFLITDTTNRLFGPAKARIVVYAGFVAGVGFTGFNAIAKAIAAGIANDASTWDMLFQDEEAFGMLRTAIASGTAFMTAQLLDVSIFDKLRTQTWWKAPIISSLIGSIVDTLIFFSIAFAGSLACPWVNWAFGDFCAKLVMIALLLYPFKLLVSLYPAHLRQA